jgi:hypothetical protein
LATAVAAAGLGLATFEFKQTLARLGRNRTIPRLMGMSKNEPSEGSPQGGARPSSIDQRSAAENQAGEKAFQSNLPQGVLVRAKRGVDSPRQVSPIF